VLLTGADSTPNKKKLRNDGHLQNPSQCRSFSSSIQRHAVSQAGFNRYIAESGFIRFDAS
jgi:hypothetical protein